MAGERLEVILERRRAGAQVVLVCEGGPGGRVTLPAGWTDRAMSPLGHRLSAESLVELMVLMAALGYPPVAGGRVNHDLV